MKFVIASKMNRLFIIIIGELISFIKEVSDFLLNFFFW